MLQQVEEAGTFGCGLPGHKSSATAETTAPCRHTRSALRVEMRGGGFASFMDGSVVHWPAHAGLLDVNDSNQVWGSPD